jgi:curved DNA-binding protein CbpA
MEKNKTFYDILDIPIGTSQKGIGQAYKKQTLIWHQGRDARSEEAQHNMFVELRRAYDTLFNSVERKKYDQKIKLNLLNVQPVLELLKREEMTVPKRRMVTSERVPPPPPKSRNVTSEKVSPKPRSCAIYAQVAGVKKCAASITTPVKAKLAPETPVAVPVESSGSIDSAVADASSEHKTEDSTVSQSEQKWYNIVGYAVKQVSEVKRPILQAYLNNSGIENKRAEAYVLSELSEDHFKAKEYREAKDLAQKAYTAARAAFSVSGSDLDKKQMDNLEQNLAMLEKKALSNAT